MKASQAEILLHIVENTHADGDDLIREWQARQAIMIEHARRILADEALIEKARELNQHDMDRFAQYMPRQQQPQQQMAERTRAALTQIKKAEKDETGNQRSPDRQAG